MAINVTQKDATLHEIIEYCENRMACCRQFAYPTDSRESVYNAGCHRAYDDVLRHCRRTPRIHRAHALGSPQPKRRIRQMFDQLIDDAIQDATVDPDGPHLYRVKSNDAGEMYGLTQLTTD